jgi:hypothetical protein
MKNKPLLLVLLSITILWSCNNRKIELKNADKIKQALPDSLKLMFVEKNISSNDADLTFEYLINENARLKAEAEASSHFSYHCITFNIFKYLTSKFHHYYYTETTTNFFGGYISELSIKLDGPNRIGADGMEYYLCKKPGANGKIYLAYRMVSDFDIVHPELSFTLAEGDKDLYINSDPFVYIPSAIDNPDTMIQDSIFFSKQSPHEFTSNEKIDYSIVSEDSKEFKRQYPNTVGYGFYLKDELDKIKDAAVTEAVSFGGYRFALGYDYSADESLIKIIIFGVDTEGKNILFKKDGDGKVIKHYPMIERNWPPSGN